MAAGLRELRRDQAFFVIHIYIALYVTWRQRNGMIVNLNDVLHCLVTQCTLTCEKPHHRVCVCVCFFSNYVPIYFSVFFIISPFFFFSKSKSLKTSHNVLFIVRFNSTNLTHPRYPKSEKIQACLIFGLGLRQHQRKPSFSQHHFVREGSSSVPLMVCGWWDGRTLERHHSNELIVAVSVWDSSFQPLSLLLYYHHRHNWPVNTMNDSLWNVSWWGINNQLVTSSAKRSNLLFMLYTSSITQLSKYQVCLDPYLANSITD